jgi:repressor LexA
MQPRTRRQREVLSYIESFINDRGHVPSYQQIARHLRVTSKGGVAKHIAALESQGLLVRRAEDGSFGLQLRAKASSSDAICAVDWISPQRPDGPVDVMPEDEQIFVTRFLLGHLEPEKVCVLRVMDNSMTGEHICEGDIALVEKRTFARDGDIVAGIITGEHATLRRFYRKGPYIELYTAEAHAAPLKLSADKYSIEGIYRGLLRPIT